MPDESPSGPPGRGRPAEERRIRRILTIVRLLAEEPGEYTRRDLAETFSVSERMITKDMTEIRQALGIEIEHPNDGIGGYYLGGVSRPLRRLARLTDNDNPPV